MERTCGHWGASPAPLYSLHTWFTEAVIMQKLGLLGVRSGGGGIVLQILSLAGGNAVQGSWSPPREVIERVLLTYKTKVLARRLARSPCPLSRGRCV